MDIFSPDHLASLADKLWALALLFIPRLLTAIGILFVAGFIAQRAARGVSRVLTRTAHVDENLRAILSELIRYMIIGVALIAALEQLGVKATSLFAALGAAGLAIGLALQGTLSNVAAGLMLLWLRPFHVGDYLEVNNVPGLSGVVRRIGLFTCQLQAFDGLFLFVPNSTLWNVALRNYSHNRQRLVSLVITVPRTFDAEVARQKILELAGTEKLIQKTPAPAVFVDRIANDGIAMNFRFWVEQANVADIQRTIITDCARVLAGDKPAESTVQVIRLIPPDSDPSRLTDTEPFAGEAEW